MIKVEVYYQKDGKIVGVSVEGHTRQGPSGKDIYCAGVSILTHSAYMGMTKHLKRKVKEELDTGKFSMFLVDPPDALTNAIFETMILGILEVKKLIPKAIEITCIEER